LVPDNLSDRLLLEGRGNIPGDAPAHVLTDRYTPSLETGPDLVQKILLKDQNVPRWDRNERLLIGGGGILFLESTVGCSG